MKKITDDLIQKFKEYLQNDEKSCTTLEKYVRDITAFMEWSQNREITKNLVLEYKQKLTGEYAPASVNSILSSLNSFFACNGWFEYKVKMLKIQRKIFANKNKELTKDEYKKLLDAAKQKKNPRLYYLMQTICSTGIRVSELKFITVESIKTKQAIVHCKGKTRQIIIPAQLCKMLKKYIEEQKIESGSIFISKKGNALDRSNIWSDMKKLCETAGVLKDKVFPHNLRHLFARTYYFMQKDIVRLADVLGHSSINTTRIYTMESGEIHRQHLQMLGLLRC